MNIDKDLMSIQNVRDCVNNASIAQVELAKLSQSEIDKICYAIAKAGYDNAKMLGQLANEETGFGTSSDKEIKNKFASKTLYESIKDMKTVGIINGDVNSEIMEVATPVGVIAGIIPSTNPTSTVIYKAMISIKGGNALVVSPHPGAKNSIYKTYEIINEAAIKAGMPKGCLQCIEYPSMQGTTELMKHNKINLILATGGNAMVRSAYSSGNPAIGVGPGNGPAFIEKTADIKDAITKIVASKTFDNGTICASEQSVIVEKEIETKVVKEMEKQGCYFLSETQANELAKFILRPNLTMNPAIVGKDVQTIAKLANIRIPSDVKILVARESNVGIKYPYSMEKLCPILAFYVENDWHAACDRSIEILLHEGAGHTMSLHTNDNDIINKFALKKPVNRLLINTASALGGIGATTNLAPALTLGCGAIGKSSTSDNITPLHLINVRRIAKHTKDVSSIIEEFKQEFSSEEKEVFDGINQDVVNNIVNEVMNQLKNNK